MRWMSANSCAALFDVTPKTWYQWVREDPTAPRPEQRTGHRKKDAA
jgi:hypothetical protein